MSNLDLALFTGLGTAQTFTRGTLTVFTVVVALDLLHTGEPGVGTLTGAIGAGAVIGSLIASLLVGSRWLAQWFGIGVALWGLPIALIPLFPQQAAALTLLACVGIGNALVDVGLFTLMARLAPDEILARVFGLFESLITLAVGLGGSRCLALDRMDERRRRIGVRRRALSKPRGSGMAAPEAPRPRYRELDAEIGLLHGVPMFQPLPLPAIEQLARGLEPVHVPAGQAVFSPG